MSRNNFCSNCGICAAVCPRRNLTMTETEYGEYQPAPAGRCAESCHLCLSVCPFSNEHGQNEDGLGRKRFGAGAGCTHYDSMGWVRDAFAGSVADESQRLQAASGGLATAVLCQMLKNKDIDAAIVLQPSPGRPGYHFRIAETEEQILASRGSVYHVVPLDQVISDVLAGPEQSYAVVALPCVAKALLFGAEPPARTSAAAPLHSWAYLRRSSQLVVCRPVEGLNGTCRWPIPIPLKTLFAHCARLSGGTGDRSIGAVRADARIDGLLVDQWGGRTAKLPVLLMTFLPNWRMQRSWMRGCRSMTRSGAERAS